MESKRRRRSFFCVDFLMDFLSRLVVPPHPYFCFLFPCFCCLTSLYLIVRISCLVVSIYYSLICIFYFCIGNTSSLLILLGIGRSLFLSCIWVYVRVIDYQEFFSFFFRDFRFPRFFLSSFGFYRIQLIPCLSWDFQKLYCKNTK